MTPSRGAATGIGQVVNDFAQVGAAEALRPFNLEGMAGAPASDVFAALADVLCPDGGTIDEAIARDAMLATAVELSLNGNTRFDAMTPAALEAVFLGTISRSIEAKLFNELGTRAIRLPQDTAAVQRIERELHSFVEGAVRDEFAGTAKVLQSMPRQDVTSLVDSLYQRAFDVLQVLGDKS